MNDKYWGDMTIEKALHERNMIVCALSKVFPSHLCVHPDNDLRFDWRWMVCVHGPTGNLVWHISDTEIKYFSHLERKENDYDGCSVEDKYMRIEEMTKAW